ncbi:MAG TPA: hypothetical protein VMA95_15580 [Streptosporangiaceae bacterium]|nr:hypothetical protein [Streptosporangiaceae bacterium]
MRKHRVVRTGVAVVAGISIGLTASAIPALAGSSVPASYHFRTLNDAFDGTFNELFGINDHKKIVGYYGSGVHGDPNRGYTIVPPYHQSSYQSVSIAGSAQTQVAGVNDKGILVGLFSRTNRPSDVNGYTGFYLRNGVAHKVTYPTGNNSNPPYNELLGINNAGVAVGDFEDASGNMHGYRFNINTHKFTKITIGRIGSLTATAINGAGTVVGYYTNGSGRILSFLRRADGRVVTIAKSGAGVTQAFGINKRGVVVGDYTIDGSSHGFVWLAGKFHTVNEPQGAGGTVISGINNAGDIVGFYTDSRGNTDGFLATP